MRLKKDWHVAGRDKTIMELYSSGKISLKLAVKEMNYNNCSVDISPSKFLSLCLKSGYKVRTEDQVCHLTQL
jgi:hypothetical protein